MKVLGIGSAAKRLSMPRRPGSGGGSPPAQITDGAATYNGTINQWDIDFTSEGGVTYDLKVGGSSVGAVTPASTIANNGTIELGDTLRIDGTNANGTTNGTTFNPTAPGKVLQLTPATIQQSGGSVTSWDDDISSYDFTPPGAQPTVASAALNGYDVVDFDYQSSQCLLSGYTPVGSLTLLVVAKFTSVTSSDPYNTLISCHLTGTPDGGFILHDYDGGMAGLLNGQTGVGGSWVSGMLHQHSTPLDTNWHVYGLVVGAAETKLIIDSVVHTDNSHGAIAAGNPLRLAHDAGTSFFDGQIAEVVLWGGDIGSSQLAAEIAALQSKYGL